MQIEYSKYKDLELYKALSDDNRAEGAFGELYSRYSQRLYAYCIRLTGNKDDANDIYQDTFYKFFDSAKSKTEVDNISSFLITIARNLFINQTRKQVHKVNIEDYNLSSNDTGYEDKELLDLISHAIELLEFDYKEAFILRQYQGYSYKEISQITGDSIAAVKNRFWRAKEKVKEILSPYMNEITNTK